MAVDQVISVTPDVQRYGLSSFLDEGFLKRITVTVSSADVNGEQISGGAQLTEKVVSPEYEVFKASLATKSIEQASMDLMVTRNRINKGATITNATKQKV